MDTENKTPALGASANATSEQKSQEQPVISPASISAEQKPEAESAEKPITPPPPADGAASPKRSVSGLWLLVVVAAVLCGAGGFVLGQGTSRVSDKLGKESPTPTVAENKKKVTTKISGTVETDAHGLNYLVLDVSEYGNVKAKVHETRYTLDPQANVEYAYVFENLMPNVPYTVAMQGCVEKDQKATCVLSRKVVTCSGRIPGGAVQQCLINGDGEADFFLDKSWVNDIISPPGTPTPTLESATPTPTP